MQFFIPSSLSTRTPRVRLVARKFLCVSVLCAYTLLGTTGTAHSAENTSQQDNELLDLSLDDLSRVKIPDVYGASKHTQKVTQAPSSVSIVTAREIQQFGYKNLGDILSGVRGFYTSTNRYYNFLGVRGFSRSGDYNSRVLVLLDGSRLNEGVYGGAFIDGALPIDVDLIDRVEVIRGPGSSLYGTGAFFAVINILPKRGKDLRGIEVSAEEGSYDTLRGRLTGGTRTQSGLDGVASITGFRSEGTPNMMFPELAGDSSLNNGIVEKNQALGWRNIFSALEYQDFRLEYAESARSNEYATGAFGTLFNSPSKNYDALKLVDLQFNHALSDSHRVFARIAYNRYDYYADAFYDYPPVTVNHDAATSESLSGEVANTTQLGKQHRVIVGLEYAYHLHAKLLNHDASPYALYLDSDNSYKNWAIFAQDEWSISENVTLNVGGRYDRSYSSISSFNPRLGLVVTPRDGTAVKLLYGTAFRAPNAWELYYDVPAVGQKAPVSLSPERIRSTELVLEQSLSAHLFAILSAYQYRIKGLITLVTDNSDGLKVFQNTDAVTTNGIDFELQGKWPWLEGRVSFSHQAAKNTQTGKGLGNSPKNLIKLNVIVPFWSETLSLGVETQYVSKRATERTNGPTVDVPSYSVTNLTLLNRNTIKGLTASVGVKNLFGKRYGDPPSDDDLSQINAIPRDGRTYWIKLSYLY